MKKILILFFFVLVIGLVWAYMHFKKGAYRDQLLDKAITSENQPDQDSHHENSDENLGTHTSTHGNRSWHKWADSHLHTYMKWTPKKEKNSELKASFDDKEKMNDENLSSIHETDSKE